MPHDVVILGVFVADAAFRCERLPRPGETLIGSGFTLGPGGKGSNQAVAAAMAGARTGFIARIGQDAFAAIGDTVWSDAGVDPLVFRDAHRATGAAGIFVEDGTGANAIVISPGAAGALTPEDVVARADAIRAARVAVTQLEQPIAAAEAFLKLAHEAGVMTILNPAPARTLPDGMLGLCDYLTPNETEAEALSGVPVTSPRDAEHAAAALMARGVRKAVIVTLGADGALMHDGTQATHIAPMSAGPAIDTSGAGDAFNGGFAAALARGDAVQDALRFATATAAVSVTRPGTAASMPRADEIASLLAQAR